MQSAVGVEDVPLNHTRNNDLRNAHRSVYVDTDYIGYFLRVDVDEGGWEGVGFTDVVHCKSIVSYVLISYQEGERGGAEEGRGREWRRAYQGLRRGEGR